jgi:uncharacterized repeat protein (TIGR01451 family)
MFVYAHRPPFARCMRLTVQVLALCLLALCSFGAHAQQTPITRYARFTGNINFVATGGSLRTQSDNGNSCAVGSSSAQTLAGIPNGASIVAAYLYWAGSGSTPDWNVTLNGSGVTAQRQFNATFNNSGTNYPFFGGFADVTNRVSGNGTFTFSGLSVHTGSPHCDSSAVLAGWGLIAIYGSPSERLRAINVFDGLQYFRGSSLTLTPDGFRIPASNRDGRMAIIAWEGDPGNSEELNGSDESLRFNSSALNDGINVPGSDPTNQPFDGTINSRNVNNSYGVDVDTFDVSSLLGPGQTSATTVFSAGGDLVLLTAQIVSVTSEPVVDLAITTSHTGSFTVGSNGTYVVSVSNAAGSQPTDFPIVVTDTLPSGLSFVSASGSGWSCSGSGQTVTCTHAGPLAAGASLPNLSLTVAVGSAAVPSATNTVQVTTPSFDPNTANNTASDPTAVLGPTLSASTKSVQDLNGGDVDPGDTLRYTITLTETTGVAASNVSVTDDIPANVSGFSAGALALPPGAMNASTYGGTGANGTGFLNVTGISVPANGTASVRFDVQVAAGTPPGATVDNTATIINPNGAGATPSAPQLVVSQSQIPGSGTKPLYLSSQGSTPILSRTPPTGTPSSVTIGPNDDSETWTMTPALQTPLTLQAGSFAVRLSLARSGLSFASARRVSVRLVSSSAGTIAQATQTITPPTGSPAQFDFMLSLPNARTLPAGSTLSLVVVNESSGGFLSDSRIVVYPVSDGERSRVDLQSATVINVDTVQTFNAFYPGGAPTPSFTRGATVFVRAVVSDPFGSFDIAAATISIVDPAATVVVSDSPMSIAVDSNAATRTYQYAFNVPANAAMGTWTVRIVANEGTEGTVSDLGIGVFQIVAPSLQVQKLSEVVSDPVNGTVNPKRIPGSLVRYSITVTNTGAGTIDANSIVITDALAPNLAVYAGTTQGDRIQWLDGTAPSGLTLNPATDVSYSNQPGGGPPFTYTPVLDPNGYDAAITGLRIAPTGTMAGAAGADTPGFTIRFLVKVQ